MPYVNIESPTQYYPETNYNCNLFYENELQNFRNSVCKVAAQKGISDPPTVRYFSERKCPIYVHQIKKDSSVFSNYDEKLTTPRKITNNQNNVNKMVLDKLEETYWATWKPKKDSMGSNKFKMPLKNTTMGLSKVKPKFYEHKALKESHGDSNDVINYFKAKRFDSSCSDTAARKASALLEANSMSERNQEMSETLNYYTKTSAKQESSVSQEIQTEVHCPVILESTKQHSLTEPEQEPVKEEVQQVKSLNKGKAKKNKSGSSKTSKELTADKPAEITENTESFVEHKDSIEITKKKQEKEGQKEHYKQPKCIRLYRKTGATTGYLKGGTYPLKSCLRKDQGPFRLGPPGSPLFITSSSFSNRKRK